MPVHSAMFLVCAPPGPVFSQTRMIALETSASVRLAWNLPTGLATVWLHKPPCAGKQAKKLGLFFLEAGPAPGHVQNIPVATLHLGKSRNGDPSPKRWNFTILLGIMRNMVDEWRNEVAEGSFYKHWTLLTGLLFLHCLLVRRALCSLSLDVAKESCFPSVFLPNWWLLWNILSSKQMSPHWLFFLFTCWAVHFWTSPVPGLSYSHAICWIGWSFWTAVLPLAQYGSSCIVDVRGLSKEARFHYECSIKLLISIGHPVYKQTANIFSDETTRIASLYKIWLDVFCNHFAGMLYSPGYCLFNRYLMWETDRCYVFSYVHLKGVVFMAAFGLVMCIGVLKSEGFMKWVATSAKLSWNS